MNTAPARRLDDPALPGAVNMARDEALLATRTTPTLRFYRWARPTLSLGYFQSASDLPLESLREQGIDLVRRETGGKAILHDRELTYSLCAPESGALAGGPGAAMQAVHEALAPELSRQAARAIELRHASSLLSDRDGSAWCFEESSALDLVIDGRKLLGSAARRRAGWVLFHGSLVVEAPSSTPDIGSIGFDPDLDALARALGNALGYAFTPGAWTEAEQRCAEQVAGRHADPTFLQKR